MRYEVTNIDVHEADRQEALMEFTVALPDGDSALVEMHYHHKRGALQKTEGVQADVEDVADWLEEDEEVLEEAQERFRLHLDDLREKN